MKSKKSLTARDILVCKHEVGFLKYQVHSLQAGMFQVFMSQQASGVIMLSYAPSHFNFGATALSFPQAQSFCNLSSYITPTPQ
jgi:hypothetical protein